MSKPEHGNAASIDGFSRQDMAILGLDSLAYVKPVHVDGVLAYAIHSADGRQLGIAPNCDMAFAAVRSHELEPVRVH